MVIPSESSGALQYQESHHCSVEEPGDPSGNAVHCSGTRTATLLMEEECVCQADGHCICFLEGSRHEKES